MAATIKAKGIVTFNPRDTAPSFVLGEMAISIDQLMEWCNGEGSEHLTEYKGQRQLKLSVKRPKDGRGIIVSVNTWKPGNDVRKHVNDLVNRVIPDAGEFNANTGDQSDLPF